MENTHKPAYPVFKRQYWNDQDVSNSAGLTKRELFAAMAMQGIMGNTSCSPVRYEHFKNIAEDAIAVADELLKQLND
jgi:hypothetical protein